MYHQGAKLYQSVSAHTSVINASQHKLVALLMKNAIDKLSIAKGNMQRNQTHDKCMNISIAISTIELLQGILDIESGKEVVINLHDLYSYMLGKLLQANLNNEIYLLEEVIQLLATILEGWENTPDAIENAGE